MDSLLHVQSLTTEAAWTALTKHGLPTVEPLGNRQDSALVTFVWRGDSLTRNVVVITPLTLLDFAGSILERLGHTDIWYRSFVLPTDARFTYRFAPNDNLVPFDRDTNMFARFGTMRADPANPEVFDMRAFGVMSILQLPRAPSDSLTRSRAGAARGRVVKTIIKSRVLGEERTIWVYTPPHYDRHAIRPYPVVVLMDGQSYQDLIPTPTILDNLIDQGSILPVIALFVDTPNQTRERDLNCNRTWETFIAAEVIPWLDQQFRTARQPRDRVIGGYSLGGLAATCAALRHADVFGNVIAQSGSFYRAPQGEPPEWAARRLAQVSRLPLRLYLSIGTYETAAIPSRDPSMLTANRHLRDVLIARGYPVRFVELSSGHEHVAWRATLGRALEAVLRPRGSS
jgi:enterochelin esterase-like enzyme